jgi:hypothetical protein
MNPTEFVKKTGPELFGDYVFPLWHCFLISCSVRFPCYLQHFGAGSCHFNSILQHFGARTAHVA